MVAAGFALAREPSRLEASWTTCSDSSDSNQNASECILTKDICFVQVLEVKALIGYFDLDPNRAIALALQAFASQPGNAAYLPLFRLFVPDSVGQTLGFLFQHAQAAGDTPDSLFAVAVALMQACPSRLEGGAVCCLLRFSSALRAVLPVVSCCRQRAWMHCSASF